MAWRTFEAVALERWVRMFPPSRFRVEPGRGQIHRIRGRFSGAPRQIDAAVYRVGADRPFLVADAKNHGRKIDVTKVEQFIGFLADVGASIGVLVSSSAPTSGAEPRAKNDPADVEIHILGEQEAAEFGWLAEARRIFPMDWAFHPELARALCEIEQDADPETVAEILEGVPFEEWEALAGVALREHAAEGRLLLEWVCRFHEDDGWRYNAARLLGEAGMLGSYIRAIVMEKEPDHEARENLADL